MLKCAFEESLVSLPEMYNNNNKSSQSEGCACGSGSTGYNPEGIGETSPGDRDICQSRITTEGGTLRDSKDSVKDTRDLRLRDVA